MRVLTYNVNHSRRAIDEFEKYSFDYRFDHVVAMINKHAADVLLIQEIPTTHLSRFVMAFPNFSWNTHAEPSRGGNFTALAIGLHNDFIGGGHPSIVSNNPGNPFLIVRLQSTLFACVHFPMDEERRMRTAAHIGKVIVESAHPDDKWVIGGDFNAFPDGNGGRQMALLNWLASTYSASEYASYLGTQTLALKTFKPYPFDPVPEDIQALNGRLDHILVHGFLTLDAVVDPSTINGRNGDEADDSDDAADDAVDAIHPSDHFPVLVVLEEGNLRCELP